MQKFSTEYLQTTYRHTSEKVIHHDHVRFIPEMQGWFNIHLSINVIKHINGLKDKNHMVVSTDAEKAFNKFQYAFLFKVLKGTGLEGQFLGIIKTYTTNPEQTSF